MSIIIAFELLIGLFFMATVNSSFEIVSFVQKFKLFSLSIWGKSYTLWKGHHK